MLRVCDIGFLEKGLEFRDSGLGLRGLKFRVERFGV